MADDTGSEERQEARTQKRYRVKENTLAFNNFTFAEIIDISEGGLSCSYLMNLHETSANITSIDLLNGAEKLHVGDIGCTQVQYRDELLSQSLPFTVRRVCGVKFTSLDQSKRQQLKNFILKSRLEPDM